MSRDLTFVVKYFRAENNRALAGTCASTRRIEYGNHTMLGANVAVARTDGVRKEPGNRPTRVYGVSPRPLAGAHARTRRIEDGETAVLGPDESVAHIGGITGESHDCPGGGDVQGKVP